MRFCPNDTDFRTIWTGNGINKCFLDTLTSSLLLVFIVVCGGIQYTVYWRYAFTVEKSLRKRNFGSVMQVILTTCLILEIFLHFILQDIIKMDASLSGVELVTFVCLLLSWGGSLELLSLEWTQFLPTTPLLWSRRHGLVLLLFWGLAFLRENLAFISWSSPEWWWFRYSGSDNLEFILWVVRYSCTALLLVLGLWAPGIPTNSYTKLEGKGDKEEDVSKSQSGIPVRHQSTWNNVIEKVKVMSPYIWPKGSPWRQCIVFICLLLLGIGRGINVLVPIYSRSIVNSLSFRTGTDDDSPLQFRWDLISMYAFLLFLRGGAGGQSGFLNDIRTFLWIQVQQYSTRRIQVKLFTHLHNLSLGWHMQKKTGEVLRVVDRGTVSVNTLLNYVVFQILPTIVDIVIAIVYFITAFNYVFGVLVFLAMGLYLSVTVLITEWRTEYRRSMNRLDNATNSRAVDSLLNFETVKYYGASEFEVEQYNNAILKYQVAEWKSTASLNLLNTLQNSVVTFGILTGSLICAWAVVNSVSGLNLEVGDYVLFGTYLIQLYGPLNYLGMYYRLIQQAFIDMENMFDLLSVEQEVKDVSGAEDLSIDTGEIEFNNVKFYYEPSKHILKSLTFTVPAGQTYALVGHSGSGKSTIIRLLFRFYDIQEGYIKIDGQDIAKVKQESLRKCVGVVPQDTVLFNKDIMYNIRYGRVTASDEEVMKAADAADIHMRILTFPNKYETVVGERGLKLSGGEKQRVAIARTLLKSPAIVLLDEATSALDTKTERNIQTSLARVCENRTTIIVAHRLSTIIHADQILVMKEGEIVERGTHDELINKTDHYHEMWQQQLTRLDEEFSATNSVFSSLDDTTSSMTASCSWTNEKASNTFEDDVSENDVVPMGVTQNGGTTTGNYPLVTQVTPTPKNA